jgi:glycosyltransferase involved in cell wall biosynthesis/SAM-dependent methyltransferase
VDGVPGATIVGFFRAEFGHGEAARRLLAGLELAGIPCSTVTHGAPSHRERHPFRERDSRGRYPTNIICLNPDHLMTFAQSRTGELLAEGYSIGVWCWETSKFPDAFLPAFDLVDEVWVASDFVRDVIARDTAKPVLTFPMPVEPKPAPEISRTELGLPTQAYVFFFMFDFLSTIERKNPLGLVEAFKRAFAPDSGAHLVLKSINGSRRLGDLARLLEAVGGREDISVIDRYASVEETRALTAAADCYVSLHRSEGFGLTIADAMTYAKPVIATAYSGNLMFTDEKNSYLVPYRLTPVPNGLDEYPAGGLWADPELDEAARLMRHVFERRAEAEEKGLRGREAISQGFSLERTAEFLSSRLEEIERLRVETRPDAAVERAAAYLARGPSVGWSAPSRFGPFGRFARRLVLRALQPYLLRHREFESAVVGALRDAEHRFELLQARPWVADEELLIFEDAEGETFGYELDEVALQEGSSPYSSFEEIFRGPESRVRELVGDYVELIGARAPVLDVGCGRGEFLDLLAEAGIRAVGVDSDPGMVARAREKGHSVELADGVAYLAEQEDGAFGAVFASHVIEHLPYEELVRFFELSQRKLAPDGLLIAETVNPHSIQAFKTFWTDPSHRAPIFPEVAVALCLVHRFQSARILFPRASGSLEAKRRTATEYAVLARKGSA